jgi:hypothetical protein
MRPLRVEVSIFKRRGYYLMLRNIALALALTFAASLIAQVIAVSSADAGPCTYTHSDKKKGYKC